MEGTRKAILTRVIQAIDILIMEGILIVILRDMRKKFTGTSRQKSTHPDREKNTIGTIEMIVGTMAGIATGKTRGLTMTAGIMTENGNDK
jgi:hypothetical protein